MSNNDEEGLSTGEKNEYKSQYYPNSYMHFILAIWQPDHFHESKTS